MSDNKRSFDTLRPIGFHASAMNSSRVMAEMKRRIAIRTAQSAFHPNATQFTMHLGDKLFGFWRQSINREQSIFAIHNVTSETVDLPVLSINLIDSWVACSAHYTNLRTSILFACIHLYMYM